MPFRAAFAFFCLDRGFGVELAWIVSVFETSISDRSYASRSQSVMGAYTSPPVPDLNDVNDLVLRRAIDVSHLRSLQRAAKEYADFEEVYYGIVSEWPTIRPQPN